MNAVELRHRIAAQRSASLIIPPTLEDATMTEPLWLTIEQAADRLQVNVRWIERAVESGDLRQYRRNRQRRYRLQDVDGLLQPDPPEQTKD